MTRTVPARGAWISAVACALALAATGCKKADKKDDSAPTTTEKAAEPAKSADPTTAGAAAGDQPAALVAPPPGAADLCGGDVEEKIGKLEVAAAPAAAAAPTAPADAPKVDPASIPKDGIPTQQIRGFAGVEQTGFRVSYGESKVPLHQEFVAILKELQVYESIATALNSTLKLPRTIDIHITDCGTVNAFYDPNNSRIIMCNELMAYFADMFKPVAKSNDELGNAIIGATIFAFFHEAGHGLIHQLDLPSTGREEDAVDQFATIILIGGGDETVSMALAGAYWFQLQQQQSRETPFYDEHAFDGQRYYNILCWIYGSDPQKYGNFVSSGTLPEQRAVRCPEEFHRTNKAWEKLLAPHMTDKGAENAEIEKAPPPPAAGGHAITCEQVAEKVAILIINQVAAELENATDEERAAAVKELEVQIPQFLEQAVQECRDKDWPDAARECVMKSEDLDAAAKCGV